MKHIARYPLTNLYFIDIFRRDKPVNYTYNIYLMGGVETASDFTTLRDCVNKACQEALHLTKKESIKKKIREIYFNTNQTVLKFKF